MYLIHTWNLEFSMFWECINNEETSKKEAFEMQINRENSFLERSNPNISKKTHFKPFVFYFFDWRFKLDDTP